MTDSLLLETRGGYRVCVPPSIASMTTYALLEQEDWFEDEIRFVRRLLEPGMNAIDIGANYGVYTLAMAKEAGSAGRVWSFEPASATAAFLRRSIAQNGFTNVELQQAALSSAPGTRRLRLEGSSELNRLADDGPGENVAVDTLDAFHARAIDAPVTFVKIDAEGEERNIIAGGAGFLSAHSPLVMIERMHGAEVNAPALGALRELGFGLYRLVPGLNVLVPFDEASADRFQLNLFACRQDRADRLAREGVLCDAVAGVAPEPGAALGALGPKPFFRTFATAAAAQPRDADAARFRGALDLYALAQHAARPTSTRWSALRQSLMVLLDLAAKGPTALRLFTLARVAAEAGERNIALQVLGKLPIDPRSYDAAAVDELFLPVSSRFESIEPESEFGLWCAVAVFEQMERLRALSSQYASDDALQFFDAFRATRFFSPEMERRRQLVRMRTGRQLRPEPAPLLAERSADNLNAAFWAGNA